MIQDRLTAKFQSAKSAARRLTRPATTTTAKPAAKAKVEDVEVTAAYERGRRAAGSMFWL